jgi:hypothetical protein
MHSQAAIGPGDALYASHNELGWINVQFNAQGRASNNSGIKARAGRVYILAKGWAVDR